MAAPDYDFKSLSPYDFEIFARDLLSAHDGLTYSTYRVGADGGVDLQANSSDGLVIVQCKHTPDASKATVARLAQAEAVKLRHLNHMPQRYVFMTSADISPVAEREISEIFQSLAPDIEVRGRGWLNSALAQYEHLERRHFKLWLTSTQAIREMLQGGVFLRGESRVRRIERNYLRFVYHTTCREAEGALEHTGCVLLTGDPGAGKTTIAEYLLLLWWHRGYRIIVDPRTVDRWWEWLEDDTPTVFFFDDTWGQTRHGDHGSRHYDSDIYEFVESVFEKRKSGASDKFLIMTSRTQVLHDTVRLSDSSRRTLEVIGTSRIRVRRLPPEVRARVLFNHVNMAVSESRVRSELARGGWWQHVADHRNYSPRIIELVLQRNQSSSAGALLGDLFKSLENPLEIWDSSFKSLPEYDQRMLLTMAMMDSQRARWQKLAKRLEGLATTDSNLDAAVERLDDSWIARETVYGEYYLALLDPSQRDYLTRYLSNSPAAMSDLIGRVSEFGDLVPICGQGEAPELDSQQKLFSVGEDILRDVLDLCAVPLLGHMRILWDRLAEESLEALDDGQPPDSLISMFESLAQLVHFHADRYRAFSDGISLPSDWFEGAISGIIDAADLMEIFDIAQLVETVSLLHEIDHRWSAGRIYRGYFAHAVSRLHEACCSIWNKREREISENDLNYASEVVEAVVKNSGSLVSLGLSVTSTSSTGYIDGLLVACIDNGELLDEIHDGLDDIEHVFGAAFPDARRKILERSDDAEYEIVSVKAPLSTFRSEGGSNPPLLYGAGSLGALFRSLESPSS
ncbi:restriction endonuclease [Kitasatospora sp. NBC_01250]|uniref:nSTAND3 domain-containing NTPase n=1 Tax=Kitasatospora sp. NBC_01250 TaxID=2903571 RepID=UPI002E3768EA|nr:restriction endonuclease [Kitasatospora sp. NBC_01250]